VRLAQPVGDVKVYRAAELPQSRYQECGGSLPVDIEIESLAPRFDGDFDSDTDEHDSSV